MDQFGNLYPGNQQGGYAQNFGMQNQFGRQQPPQTQQSQPVQSQSLNGGQAVFQCWPVMSRGEAEQASIDFLGPGVVMPNLGQGMVYLKRFNPQKGEIEVLDFAFVPPPPPPAPAPVYDPQNELAAMRADMATLQASVTALCSELEKNKKSSPRTAGGKAAE